eukprot:GHVT01022562.1.p1 GENE.GHVT01022562.1~~GHVT01022562.1.p1  ORF type:complete len:124 (-),score=4.90 GHVT01022562.1:309-680(-)
MNRTCLLLLRHLSHLVHSLILVAWSFGLLPHFQNLGLEGAGVMITDLIERQRRHGERRLLSGLGGFGHRKSNGRPREKPATAQALRVAALPAAVHQFDDSRQVVKPGIDIQHVNIGVEQPEGA